MQMEPCKKHRYWEIRSNENIAEDVPLALASFTACLISSTRCCVTRTVFCLFKSE